MLLKDCQQIVMLQLYINEQFNTGQLLRYEHGWKIHQQGLELDMTCGNWSELILEH